MPGTIACAACGRPLTWDDAAIEVLGAHRHACTNPHGYAYDVVCFAAADGVDVTSNPSSEWSWFPGCRWQTEACGGCGALVGWLFRRGDDQVFHGLIESALERIS